MWRTSQGDRILEGDEAAVFVRALRLLRDTLVADSSWDYGCVVFDRLTLGQRLAVLCEVAAGLLDPSVPPPELTAANEGAIASVYSNLSAAIEDDEESPAATDARRLVHRACRALGFENTDAGWPSNNADPEAIQDAIEFLRDRILWDADYADEDLFLDLEPQAASALHEFVRTSRVYYLHIPPDPPESEIEALLRRLDCFLSN